MAYDKKLHLAAGFLIAVIMGFIVDPITGIGLAIVAGVAKECYDDWKYDGYDIKDMIATWIGGACGFALIALIKYWK